MNPKKQFSSTSFLKTVFSTDENTWKQHLGHHVIMKHSLKSQFLAPSIAVLADSGSLDTCECWTEDFILFVQNAAGLYFLPMQSSNGFLQL